MKKKIVQEVFDILTSYPAINWQDCYYALFEISMSTDDKNLTTQIFYQITLEAIRTKNKWILEEFIDKEGRFYPALLELDLYKFATDLIREIPKKRYNTTPHNYIDQELEFDKSFMFQFRPASYILCACCFEFDLTCEEIQEFPLVNEESYIRETFGRALKQKEIHKRHFVLDRILKGYLERGPCFSLLLELWLETERSGIHIDPGINDEHIEELLKPKYFKIFLQIINFRHRNHDSLIDDIIILLQERGKHGLALYLNAKISTPKNRIFDAVCEVLVKEIPQENDLIYLQRVIESVKHEKVEND